jgi:UDP-galactopyranose mutase
MFDWLITGAGFAGSVLAERIARKRNESVLVIDRRDHIGGNAYDHLNADGILIHKYGPHIFHTSSADIFNYLSNFTAWRPYEHRVLAQVDGKLLPIPINLDTVNRLYGLNLNEKQVAKFYADRAEPVNHARNSEEMIVSQVGRDLFEKFFRGYTLKQWGIEPRDLDASVTARIPIRTNRDDRYFGDTFQKMPLKGYTPMFNRMLNHPNIEVRTSTDFREIEPGMYKNLIYTGPVDEYFGHRYGKLPYRSLRFVHETKRMESVQPVATVNYPQTERYTRITEFKKLTGQKHPFTSLCYEYPCADGDPFYPIPRKENAETYKKYEELARRERQTWFVGRLATYKYYNMDQVVGQALKTFQRIEEAMPARRPREAGSTSAAEAFS